MPEIIPTISKEENELLGWAEDKMESDFRLTNFMEPRAAEFVAADIGLRYEFLHKRARAPLPRLKASVLNVLEEIQTARLPRTKCSGTKRLSAPLLRYLTAKDSIWCESTLVAAIVTFREIGKHCKTPLGIDHSFANGRALVQELPKGHPKFVFVTDSPLWLHDKAPQLPYRLLLPVHWEEQFVLRKKGARTTRNKPIAYIYADSSADEEMVTVEDAFKTKAEPMTYRPDELKWVPIGEAAKVLEQCDPVRCPSMTHLRVAIRKAMVPEDCVIAWEPLYRCLLKSDPTLELIPGVYCNSISLYCHTSVNAALRNEFKCLFDAVWTELREERNRSPNLFRLQSLIAGEDGTSRSSFLRYFATGAGINDFRLPIPRVLEGTADAGEPAEFIINDKQFRILQGLKGKIRGLRVSPLFADNKLYRKRDQRWLDELVNWKLVKKKDRLYYLTPKGEQLLAIQS